ERLNTANMPPPIPHIVHVQPTFSKEQLETALADEPNNALKTNLYPTRMHTNFQLLAQSPTDTEDARAGNFEIEIITGDVKKKINELAQRGYRLLLRPHLFEAAVMHRKKDSTAASSYAWIGEKQL